MVSLLVARGPVRMGVLESHKGSWGTTREAQGSIQGRDEVRFALRSSSSLYMLFPVIGFEKHPPSRNLEWPPAEARALSHTAART